jgi:hypothetical protein
MLRFVSSGVILSGWGKLSHALLYGYMLLEIFMAYFNVNN